MIKNHEIEACFDTGAELSIMAHETTLNYIKIKVADYRIQNAIGQTKPLRVIELESRPVIYSSSSLTRIRLVFKLWGNSKSKRKLNNLS